ncbi:hypothetical protein QR680_001370 [Steinernema hermaphroditum]|uniref:Uncharacterized protein n=1 Tax=Steinernema hermaphroditum TaxID=289476 RepID=A0AA39LFS3_9BILA|nr:hypothetical protein QR680_001370 [Steinernema hermaphroditum]
MVSVPVAPGICFYQLLTNVRLPCLHSLRLAEGINVTHYREGRLSSAPITSEPQSRAILERSCETASCKAAGKEVLRG